MSENVQHRKSASTTSSSDDEGWELELENSIESNTNDQVLVAHMDDVLEPEEGLNTDEMLAKLVARVDALETENKFHKDQKGLICALN
jgi:hypothetical protein